MWLHIWCIKHVLSILEKRSIIVIRLLGCNSNLGIFVIVTTF